MNFEAISDEMRRSVISGAICTDREVRTEDKFSPPGRVNPPRKEVHYPLFERTAASFF